MFKVQELLKPISSTQACGDDISFLPEVDLIIEARRFEDPSLDQGAWVTEVKTADWPYVIEHCAALISTRSKDLRLAVWLTEASAKVDHFAGLAQGYTLLAGLCDDFWDGLYPSLQDEGDQEQRIGNLHWILSRSAQLIKEVPITEGRSTSYSTMDFESARTRTISSERASAEDNRAEDGLKLADFEAARRKSSKGFYEKLLNDAKLCQSALLQLEQAVDARLGIDGPGFSATKDALENTLKLISRFAQDAGVQGAINHASQEDANTGQEQVLSEQNHATHINYSNGVIQSRTQALAQLRAVADFFRHTEPHSPVAYLADKAAHWGEMPLHAWLSAVIKDPASLSHVEELLGLDSPPEQSGNSDQG